MIVCVENFILTVSNDSQYVMDLHRVEHFLTQYRRYLFDEHITIIKSFINKSKTHVSKKMVTIIIAVGQIQHVKKDLVHVVVISIC